MGFRLLTKNKRSILTGVWLAIFMFLLKWLQWRFVVLQQSFEIYTGAVAVLFTALGIWLSKKLISPSVETLVIARPVYGQCNFILNEAELNRLHVSKRELEVLQLMAGGLSNQQIAEQLFVSRNTIKTHSSNLFLKLEVGRRTQAIEKGRRLSLIP